MNKQIGYKFIKDDMHSKYGTDSAWKVGKWKKHNGTISICNSGYHACVTAKQSLGYVYGGRWFIVEARGEIVYEKDDKFVASEMRLVKEIKNSRAILVEYALKCAWHVLKIYEKKYPSDKRVRHCLVTLKKWLANPSVENLAAVKIARDAAADAAAYAAADAAVYATYATYAAAYAAVYATYATYAAAYAAADAAVYPTYATYAAAPDAAARAKERSWQEKTLNKIIARVNS
jgi:hypothetical protein